MGRLIVVSNRVQPSSGSGGSTQGGLAVALSAALREYSGIWFGWSGENGYIESFNARLRDELLNGEIFYSLEEVRCVTGWWRDHYNRLRPHSSLG